jgi:hypothetical protein
LEIEKTIKPMENNAFSKKNQKKAIKPKWKTMLFQRKKKSNKTNGKLYMFNEKAIKLMEN